MHQPKRHCVRRGLSSTLPKKRAEPPIFGPCLWWPNGCMDQDATWYGGRPRPRQHCARWDPAPLAKKGAQTPNFRPMSMVPKRLDRSRCHVVWRYRPRIKRRCVRWGPSYPLPKRGAESSTLRPMSIVAKQLHGSRCHFVRR